MITLTNIALLAALAQQPATPAYKRDVPDSLAVKVKVSEDSARAIALRRVPGGMIQALELEREGGALLYSWDIKVAGKPGITEVHVNALTGRILSVEHEKN
ncbi:MAG TPA: PepSY domain-containing protein [Gemmatimonadales bacterium]|nr:PepSY domain-containing protein [Gemmatimonadales bacterium]